MVEGIAPIENLLTYRKEEVAQSSPDMANGWCFSKWGGVNGEEVAEVVFLAFYIGFPPLLNDVILTAITSSILLVNSRFFMPGRIFFCYREMLIYSFFQLFFKYRYGRIKWY